MSEHGDGDRLLSVLHLCAPSFVGGLERVVQGLSVGEARRGHRVGVAAVIEPSADASAFLAPMRAAGVETIELVIPGRAYLRERKEVRALLARFRPDVLHTHGYRSDMLHAAAARRRRIATVSTLHGSSRMGGLSTVLERLQERALAQFDAVVVVSRQLTHALARRGLRPDRCHLVPNAWAPPETRLGRDEARACLGETADDLLIGWVGRLIPVKGCDVFLDSLAEISRPGWKAIVIGDGPERGALEQRVNRLGLGDRVRLLGAVPDAERFFPGLDVFVLSSRSEGTPMVLLEAMGAGVPSIASSVGGVPAVVRKPENGWLVTPESPKELAAAITESLGNPASRAARGRAGAQRIASAYDFESWISRHEEIYRSVLRSRRGR